MWIGASRNCKREVLGLKWPKCPIKCLGVYLTYDYDEFIKLNYKQRLKKMEYTANWWRGRGLTMLGRAQIINSLLLSKLIYIASMFPVREEVVKEVNRIIFKFLWKGQDRVARKAMINNFENGGLNVLDFETMVNSLRLAWLKRLYIDEDAGCKRYLRFLTKPFGGDFLFRCDYGPREYNITNKFYGELIQFWAEYKNAFSTEDDSTSIIWNNKNIRINGKPVFYRRFFDKNLISIRQLRLHLNSAESLDLIRTDLELNCNFLMWAGLRLAIAVSLRGKENDVRLTNALGFYDNNNFF